jgi:Tol biopolymer transport system component
METSRDGRRLAYTRWRWNSNIYRIELSGATGLVGTPKKLIASTRFDYDPDYSPNGDEIVFVSTRTGNEEIWVCEADGTSPRQLTSIGGPLTSNPRWSPDGQTIVFDSRREGSGDLYLISPQGGAPRRLTDDPGLEGEARWSRDGKWIYFHSDRSGRDEVWKLSVDGGEPVQVTRKGGRGSFESADGERLFYSKDETLWTAPITGGDEERVLDSLTAPHNFVVTDSGIYFVSGDAADFPANLSIKFFDFSSRETMPIHHADRPWWLGLTLSPDGRWILFSQSDHLGSDLMLVEISR